MSSPIDELTRHRLENLSDEDLMFLVKAFANKRNDHDHIKELVAGDSDIIEQMVNSDRVFRKVMDKRTTILSISPFFFFTLLIRRAFRDLRSESHLLDETIDVANRYAESAPWNPERARRLLNDSGLVNYLANMITTFSETSRVFKVVAEDEKSFFYIVDLIQESLTSDRERQFWIYCHIGNYSLFLTGLFPEFIVHRFRYKRRPVDESFYIGYGKTYYALAGGHELAQRRELDALFAQLSTGFEVIKQSLNYMKQHYLRN